MQTVRQWLEQLGLPQYAEVFAENDVDLEALRLLAESDLEKLGVSLGNRKKLLNAIAQLDDGRSPALPTLDKSPQQESHRAEAERRQLTVMFCDLVGSTELATKLDPEQLRDLMQSYQRACGEVIARYDGHVAQYLGDGLMVYFGWPRAHEDDAERAVRASLEIVAAVKQVTAPSALQVRVGIATGPVVVGETGAGDASVPKLAVGETPNLAARLQSLAGADGIVIAPITHRLLATAFEYADLGQHPLKGILEPVHAWRVLGVGRAEGRFEASQTSGLTPLVGREEEIALLLRRWEEAKAGEGQVVLLAGEPGIGKSRVARVLRERIEGQEYLRLRYQCSPFHTQSALYPVIEQCERAANFSKDDSVEDKLDKLEALLQQGLAKTQLDAVAPLYAALVSLPVDRYPPLNYSPQKHKELTLQALVNQVDGLAKRQPLLMVFEDVHWVDPTTQQVLDLLVPRIAQLPVLLLLTYRPEYAPHWSGEAHVTALTLSRLNRKLGAQLADKVTGGKTLPREVLEQIVAKTDGVPLFVEELTKAVLESGLLRLTDQGYELAGPLTSLAIPSTLHDSLMARLDRLSEVREVAQIGACIGREFPYDLLSAVSPLPQDKLQAALEQLASAELIFRRGTPPDALYSFKHALVQDAAYASLLKSRRQIVHRTIAEALEKRYPERVASEPEVAAHHCTEAGLYEQAALLWGRAGQRSLDRSALLEAIVHITRALDQIGTLPATTPALRREQIKLQVALLTPLIHVKGYAAPETTAAAERARILIEQAEAINEPPEDPLLLFSVLYSFWVARFVAFNGKVMRELAAQFLSLAKRQGSVVPLMVGHRNMGVSLLHTGDFVEARVEIDRAIALFDPVEHRHLATRFGQDVRVALLFYRSLAHWSLGYPKRALDDADRAIKEAREIDQAVSLIAALTITSLTYIHCGNYAIANAHLPEAIKLASEKGALFWLAGAVLVKGSLLVENGKTLDAIRMIASGVNEWRATGATVWVPTYLSYLARAHAELGQFDEARRCIGDALTTTQTNSESWYEAEVNRIAGEITLRSPDADVKRAEAYFEQALAVARAQRAKSWELRAATSMARLWRDQGRCNEACGLLAPVYRWFTEGFDTKDLKQAKALLEELE